MKIISELTGLEYKTVEECEAAEKAFEEKVKAEKEAKEKAIAEKKAKDEELAKIRKARAIEIEAAYKASVEATKHYQDLLQKFCKDYGSFHMTLHTGDLNPFDSFAHWFNTFPF